MTMLTRITTRGRSLREGAPWLPGGGVPLAAAIVAALIVAVYVAGLAAGPGGGTGSDGGGGQLASRSEQAPPPLGGGIVPADPATPIGGEAVGVPEPSVAEDSERSSATADGEGSAPMTTGAFELPKIGLKVIQSGSLVVRVPEDELQPAFGQATAITRTLGGYVVSSQVTNTTFPSASLVIKVPNRSFSSAMERLGEIGTIQQMTSSSEDVTQQYADSDSRLRTLVASRDRLTALLARAKNTTDALLIQDRLAAVQQQLEQEKANRSYLDGMANMATVQLTLRERRGDDAAESGGSGWGFSDALDTSAHRFVDTINNGIVALGGALPALILLAAVALVARAGMRRRRARLATPAAQEPVQ